MGRSLGVGEVQARPGGCLLPPGKLELASLGPFAHWAGLAWRIARPGGARFQGTILTWRAGAACGFSERRGQRARTRGRGRQHESSGQRLVPASFAHHQTHSRCARRCVGTRDPGTETPPPHEALSPGPGDPLARRKPVSSGLCRLLRLFVLCSAASQRLAVPAASGRISVSWRAGFGEQSRVWFRHLIQFVLPRLKYEMVASQTFKGPSGRESGRLLKFKF